MQVFVAVTVSRTNNQIYDKIDQVQRSMRISENGFCKRQRIREKELLESRAMRTAARDKGGVQPRCANRILLTSIIRRLFVTNFLSTIARFSSRSIDYLEAKPPLGASWLSFANVALCYRCRWRNDTVKTDYCCTIGR